MEETVISIQTRRCRILRLSTFDCLTKAEVAKYNAYSKAKKDERQILKADFLKEINQFGGIREVPDCRLYTSDYCGNLTEEYREDKQIALFENELIRLSDQLIYKDDDPWYIPLITDVVSFICYHNEILRQVIGQGIFIHKEKYIFFSASTNQMKEKQVLLIKEAFYEKNKKRLMCGLTIDEINAHGGCNTGKYLAYTSLVLSSSMEPETEINIDDVIALPDFQTDVTAEVNYLDVNTLQEKRRVMAVPIPHMDGAGIFLPDYPALKSSAQIRGGWMKGCVFPFDFRQFIIEKQDNGTSVDTITDLWGDEVDINYIRDNVKMIITGSQLKMWKHYASWKAYKKAFKESGTKICINNYSHPPKCKNPTVHLSYQFLQTIPRGNLTDEALKILCQKSVDVINNAKTDPRAALRIMGLDEEELEKPKSPLLASIEACPDFLKDRHVQKSMEKAIKAEQKKAKSGKVLVDGYYSYICPDLYAACEFWFCGDINPKGLIPAGHVYNAFYKKQYEEVCCLRSPHLSDCEHGVRKLISTEECRRWYSGYDTIISTHDLLTKTLQNDVDGDKMLITPDDTFINLVDRGKLPLYYEMGQTNPLPVTNGNIFKCLCTSFEQSIIGDISNCLTKEFNRQQEPDMHFVHVMCAYNNYTIDFPKTQLQLNLDASTKDKMKELADSINPYFFRYAKDKKVANCYPYEPTEKSNINRISKYIQKGTAGGKMAEEANGFNAQLLFDNRAEYKVDRKCEKYKKLMVLLVQLKRKQSFNEREIAARVSRKLETQKLNYQLFYFFCNQKIRKIYGDSIMDRRIAANYLLDMEYYLEENLNTNKNILWNCFGDVLYQNLAVNLGLPDRPKLKRMAYQSRNKKERELENAITEVMKEVEEERKVTIYHYDLDWINSFSYRKNSPNDRYILFILLVLYKRATAKMSDLGKEPYAVIACNRKNQKAITKATIDGWCGIKTADRAIERLFLKHGAIKIIELKKSTKIFVEVPIKWKKNCEALFEVGAGNPLVYFFEYTGERKVANCKVCDKKYIVYGNTKTCGTACSRILELRNKNAHKNRRFDT